MLTDLRGKFSGKFAWEFAAEICQKKILREFAGEFAFVRKFVMQFARNFAGKICLIRFAEKKSEKFYHLQGICWGIYQGICRDCPGIC